MKWDTIKKTVASGAYTSIILCANPETIVACIFHSFAEKKPPRESIQDLADIVYERIMKWDVRMVGKLRELFPYYFPKSLQKGILVAEYNEKCEWEIYECKNM